MNLRTRIPLLVVGFILAGIWGLAAHLSELLQRDIERMISTQLAAQVRYVGDELDEELRMRLDLLQEIAAQITLDGSAATADLQKILDQSNPPRLIFPLGLLIVDKDGVVIADHPPLSAARRAGPTSERDFFRRVIADNGPRIGRPILLPAISPQPIIPLGVPLHAADGSLAGILFGPVLGSDHDLFGKLEETRVGASGRFMVISPRTNTILFATGNKQTLKPLPARGINRMHDRRIYEGFEAPAVSHDPAGVEVLGVSRNMKSTGWVLVGNITTKEAFGSIRAFRTRIYVAAALVSLGVAVILFFVLKRELLRLEMTGTAMRRMTEGAEPFAPIPVSRDDEIGRLVGSFNRLVMERQRAETEIRTLNHTLEERVQERTDELLRVNRQLLTEIKERKAVELDALNYAKRLQDLSRRMVSAVEAERRRLAAELHDRVSSNLAAIGIDLDMIDKHLSRDDSANKLGERLADCIALLHDAAASARDISSDMHPATLDYLGLVPALEDLAEKTGRRTGISVRVKGPNHQQRLPAEKEIGLFRIAQEALVNCVKHAHAEAVEIKLSYGPDRIELSVGDDGRGFDPSETGKSGRPSGLGLLSMQERAEAIGGSCHIESAPGKGTKLTVWV